MSVKLLSKPLHSEEALKILRASSPRELPLDHLFISLVVVTRDDFKIDIKTKQIDKERYICTGSVEDWTALFLSNPRINLDPFFNVLSPVIKVKKEGAYWISK